MNKSQEIWKDIDGYEGFYQISNYGNVKSLSRKIINRNTFYIVKERRLNSSSDGRYLCLHLSKSGKRKPFKIHRLVAEAFIPDKTTFKSMPDEDRTKIDLNKLEVNHKDENKFNNHVGNLEWCTRKYNNLYNNKPKRDGLKRRKPVAQYDNNGNCLAVFSGVRVAGEKTNVNASVIIRKCKDNNYNNQDGFVWKYLERKNYE